MYITVNAQIERNDFDNKAKRDSLLNGIKDMEETYSAEKGSSHISVNLQLHVYDIQLDSDVYALRKKYFNYDVNPL